MFKAIKEFFFGKPQAVPEVAAQAAPEAPYKVEAPAVSKVVGNVPLGNGSGTFTDPLLSVTPKVSPAPAKRPAARRRTTTAKKPAAPKAE
jgi:hypothetical protein